MSRRISRFAITGLVVTGLHVLVALMLIRMFYLSSPAANVVAFCVATFVSYCLNTLWSFSGELRLDTLKRFVIVSCVGLIIVYVVSSTARFMGCSDLLGIFFVVCVNPLASFLMHNFWTYKDRYPRGLQSPSR